MNSIKLVNTLTKEEAEKKYQEFVNGVKKHNKKIVIAVITTIAVIMSLETLFWFVLSGGWQDIMMVVFGIIACLVLGGLIDNLRSDCKLFHPPVYLYHKILETHQVLNVKDEVLKDNSYALVLDIADNAGEVSQKYLYGFKKVEKIGIDQTTADLVERKIFVPYSST